MKLNLDKSEHCCVENKMHVANKKWSIQNWENVPLLCFILCARLRESHTFSAFSHYLEENAPFYPKFNVFLLLYLGKTEILNT